MTWKNTFGWIGLWGLMGSDAHRLSRLNRQREPQLPVDVKYTDHHAIDDEHAGCSFGDVADIADRVEIWHRSNTSTVDSLQPLDPWHFTLPWDADER